MQELRNAYKASKGPKAEDIPGTNAQIVENLEDLGGDPTMQDANWEHQAALRNFRVAVIDTIMVACKSKAATPELSRSTQVPPPRYRRLFPACYIQRAASGRGLSAHTAPALSTGVAVLVLLM